MASPAWMSGVGAGVGVGIDAGDGGGGGTGATIGTGVDWTMAGGGAICATSCGETTSATTGSGSGVGCGLLVGARVGDGIGEGVGVISTIEGNELGLSSRSAYGADGMLAELPPPLKVRKPTLMTMPQMNITPRASAIHCLFN